ncbi:MAG: hypothetical protein AAB848_00375 [Patescibacteria group bacterium]
MKPRDFGFSDWLDECTDPNAVPIFTGDVRDLPEVLGVHPSCLTIRDVKNGNGKAHGVGRRGDIFGDGCGYRGKDVLGGADSVDNLQHEVSGCVYELGLDGADVADCELSICDVPTRPVFSDDDEEDVGAVDVRGIGKRLKLGNL